MADERREDALTTQTAESTAVDHPEDSGPEKGGGILGGLFGRKVPGKHHRRGEETDAADEAETTGEDGTGPDYAGGGTRGRKRRKEKVRRKDERLASVVDESEPGAAVDTLRQVEPFTIPGENIAGGAWLILVLPTADKAFGGLSRKQNRDEDKGQIINLIQADEINTVATPDLLDDDALGIIPNATTLERMDEFGILRDARYFWGVVVIDPDTGALMVYTVPPKREEDASGELFETAAAVVRGDFDITEVVDLGVVQTMWQIFNADGEDYGANGVLDAIDVNMDYLGSRQVAGLPYPSGQQLVDNLWLHFPKVDPNYDPEDEDAMAIEEGPVTAQFEAVDPAPMTTEDNNDAREHDPVPAQPEDAPAYAPGEYGDQHADDAGVDASVAGTDGPAPSEMNEAEDEAPVEAEDEAPVEGVSVAPVDNPRSDQQAPAQLPQTEQVLALQQQGLSDEEINLIAMRQAELLVRFGIGAPQQQGQQIQQPINDPTKLTEEIRRSYVDDELGLTIDTAPFDREVYGQVPQLTFNAYESQTPWLNEQLRDFVTQLNAGLETNYVNRREKLRSSYLQLVETSRNDVVAAVDAENESSRFFAMRSAAERDRASMLARVDEQVTEDRRAEIEKYERDKQHYVEDRMGELRVEYDRRNKADLEHRLGQIAPIKQMTIERIYDTSLQSIHERRRMDAHARYDIKLARAMEMLRPDLDAILDAESQEMQDAIDQVKAYFDDNAKDDLVWAETMRENFERDNRVEEIVAQTRAQLASAREEADEKVAAIRKQMVDLRDGHDKFIADLNRDNAARLAQAQARVDDARADRDAANHRAEERIEQAVADAEARVAAEKERSDQAQANSDAQIDAIRRDNTMTIVTIIAIAVVMLIAGLALGGWVL